MRPIRRYNAGSCYRLREVQGSPGTWIVTGDSVWLFGPTEDYAEARHQLDAVAPPKDLKPEAD